MQGTVRQESEVFYLCIPLLLAPSAQIKRVLMHCRSYNVSPEELFDLFGKFGPVRYVPPASHGCPRLESAYSATYRQIRQGMANNTKGTAFVVYEDVMDAKQACDKLNGFNFQNRYLVGQRSHASTTSLTSLTAMYYSSLPST